MNAAALVQEIEGKFQQLLRDMTAELKSNLGTSHYRRLSEEEVFRRASVVFEHMNQWLITRDESALRREGEALGKRRFTEGVPLGQVVLALILNEKYLWNLLGERAQQIEKDVRGAVTEFFQRHTYYTAKGYEVALAESNRLAKRAAEALPPPEAAAPKPPSPKEPAKGESDMEISRGGQVGEFGG
jgi:hypothetical protein